MYKQLRSLAILLTVELWELLRSFRRWLFDDTEQDHLSVDECIEREIQRAGF